MASDQPERASLCDIRLPHSSRGVWKRIPDELLWTGHPLGFTSGQVLWWWVSHLDSYYLVMEGLLSSTPETEESVQEGNFSYTVEMLEFGYMCWKRKPWVGLNVFNGTELSTLTGRCSELCSLTGKEAGFLSLDTLPSLPWSAVRSVFGVGLRLLAYLMHDTNISLFISQAPTWALLTSSLTWAACRSAVSLSSSHMLFFSTRPLLSLGAVGIVVNAQNAGKKWVCCPIS